MAGIKDILEIEQTRETAEDWRRIHLFQEGSFYRAYEVSAWLCHKHISQFRVTHRHVKGIESTIAFVGFPLLSLEKRTPEGARVVSIADKHLAMDLPDKGSEADVECLGREFEEWKTKQPLAEQKEDGDKDKHVPRSSNGVTAHPTLFSIAHQILAYPIESHSPIECMLFLAEVKNKITRVV